MNSADDETIIKALIQGKKAGMTIMAHAENADMVDFLTKKLIAEGKTGAYYHAASRPPIVESAQYVGQKGDGKFVPGTTQL